MANEIRKPPVGAIFGLHLPRVAGKCDWCGEPCEDRTPVRKQLRQRHYACDSELAVIERPEQARWYVEHRDHGVCVDCREDWSDRYVVRAECKATILEGNSYADAFGKRGTETHFVSRYNSIIWISLWHVDHKVPLWKVWHMPPIQRIEYFKLANLVTRCEPCHKIKTRQEAAERAKFNAMAIQAEAVLEGKSVERKSRWAKGPKLSGRRFPPKGSRPMRRR